MKSPVPNPRHCSFETFWLGYCDWWAERTRGGGSGSLEAGKPHGSIAGLIVVVCVGVLLSAGLVALVAPALAGGMSAAGTAAVAWASRLLMLAAAAFLFVWLPFTQVRRVHRFCGEMCLRGQQLKSGERMPVRLL